MQSGAEAAGKSLRSHCRSCVLITDVLQKPRALPKLRLLFKLRVKFLLI